MRILTVSSVVFSLAAASAAQFNGPAPLAWRFVQPTSVAPGGSPVVDGNTIYQSLGGRVYSIDKESGNLKWRFPQVDPIQGAFRTSPVLIDGTLVVTGDNKLVYGVNPANGQLKWSYPTEQPVYGAPTVVGDNVVFATSDNKLHALKAADGSSIWSTPYTVHDGVNGTIMGWQNSVIFFTNRTQMMSVDLTTRNRNWVLPFTQLPPNPTPVLFGDTIYTISGPYIIAMNPQSGTARWQIATRDQLAFAPAVSAEGIFAVTQDGKLLAYKPTREAMTKSPIVLGTSAVQRPTAVGSMVVIPSSAGGVLLVDPTKWTAPTTGTGLTTGSLPTSMDLTMGDPSGGSILWNYLIRPINEAASKPSGGANPGGAPGFGAPGGGGVGGGSTQQQEVKVVTIQANAPAVVAGDTLLIAAKDGSLLAFDRNLGVDLTAPTVKMVFPNPGDQVSGQPPLLLAFRLEDDTSGIDTRTIKVDIEGQEYDATFNRDGLLLVRFSMTNKNRPLSDGRKTITVTAVDWMGNVAKKSFALTIDNTLKPVVLPGGNTGAGAGGPGGGGAFGGGAGGL